MVAFFIGAILYFVGYAVQTFRNDITTVTVYETGVEDSMDTTGLVVRQETLLEGSGERMEALTEMDTDFMLKTLDYIKVFENGTLLVVFLDGLRLNVEVKKNNRIHQLK